MFAIVICLRLLMCTLTIRSSVLCVLIFEGMSVVVNVMVSLMRSNLVALMDWGGANSRFLGLVLCGQHDHSIKRH